MAWSTSIRVVNKDGVPVKGARVTINIGFWDGFVSDHTDDDGRVEFVYHSIGELENVWIDDIYVGGRRVDGNLFLPNGETRLVSFGRRGPRPPVLAHND